MGIKKANFQREFLNPLGSYTPVFTIYTVYSVLLQASPAEVRKGEMVTVTASFKNETPASLTNGQFHFEAVGMLPKSAAFYK